MIRFKILKSQECVIVDNGKSYLFKQDGTFNKKEENILPEYMNGALELPIISVLSSKGHTELYVMTDDNNINIYETKQSPMMCAMQLSSEKFIRMLRRDGTYQGLRYNQLVFVFKEGTNVEDIVKLLK